MSHAKKPGTPQEPRAGDAPLKKHEALSEALASMYGPAHHADQVPGGEGEFGHAPTNPIPTRSRMESMRYLARLRLASGERVLYRRSGSLVSARNRHLIDRFEISSQKGELLATLYLSHYYNRTSEKAPEGFVLEAEAR